MSADAPVTTQSKDSPPPTVVLTMAEIVAKSPDPVGAIRTLGQTIARSQMAGPTDREEVGQVLVLLCITEGWTLGELLRTYQISFGRLEKRIDAAVAEFRSRGGKIDWLADGSDGQQARARFTLGTESIEAGCTVEEAKKAGWTKNAKWTTEPATMLRARTKKRGVLALAPDIFFGEYADDGEQQSVTLSPEQMASAAASTAVTQATAPQRSVTPSAPQTPPAPAPSKAPAPAPAATAPAPASAPAGAELPAELQTQLLTVIGADKLAAAQEWAVSVGWLAAGASIDALPEKHAKAIIARPERFKASLETYIAKKAGAK